LTAAHCVEKGPVWLLFPRDGKIQVDRPRIVWRGDKRRREPDLAVLWVSQPIGPTFQWANEFKHGSPVVDVGLNLDHYQRDTKPQFVLKASESLSGGFMDYSVVTHSSPFRPGDSGGPLVLSDGRLLGINVIVKCDFRWRRFSFEFDHSEAHRPDLAWVRKVIDADASLRAMSRANHAPRR